MHALDSVNKINPDSQHEKQVLDEHDNNNEESIRRKVQRSMVHTIPTENMSVKESTTPHQKWNLNRNKFIPILNMTRSIASESSNSCTFGRRRSTGSVFEEGTSTFTRPIALSLLELGSNTEQDAESIFVTNTITEEYSSKIFEASLLFNIGANEVWNSNFVSARTHFNQALALLLGIDYSVIHFIPNISTRHQVLQH